jgi:hypothetical protein
MAKWMTKEECGKQLRVGEFIMGSKAKGSDKRTIKVSGLLSQYIVYDAAYCIVCRRFIGTRVMCKCAMATPTYPGNSCW